MWSSNFENEMCVFLIEDPMFLNANSSFCSSYKKIILRFIQKIDAYLFDFLST